MRQYGISCPTKNIGFDAFTNLVDKVTGTDIIYLGFCKAADFVFSGIWWKIALHKSMLPLLNKFNSHSTDVS